MVHIRRQRLDCALSIYLHDFEYGQQYANRARTWPTMPTPSTDTWQAVMAARAEGAASTSATKPWSSGPRRCSARCWPAPDLDWQPAMLDFWRRDTQVATYSDQQVKPLNRQGIDTWPSYRPAADKFLRTLDPAAMAAADAGSGPQ